MTLLIPEILRGARVPLDGLSLILKSPKALMYSLAPGIIGFTVFVFSIYFGFSEIYSLLKAWILGYLGQGWYSGFLGAVFSFFGSLSALILLILLVYAIYSILAGPFFSFLTEEIFKKTSPKAIKSGSAPLMVRMFYLSLLKILIFLPIGFVAFLFSFFPPFNLLAYFLIFLTLSFDSMDYAFETDYLGLGDRFRFFRGRWPYFVGLAGSLGLTSLLPGLLFLVFPLFVAGSTKLYVDLNRKGC